MKIVINKCYGGYGLSEKASDEYVKRAKLQLNKRGRSYCKVPVEEYEAILNLEEAERAKQLAGEKHNYKGYQSNDLCWGIDQVERDDPILIEIVEELGEAANGECSQLKIVEIPDDIEYEIEDYDGVEWIAEKHRTWR